MRDHSMRTTHPLDAGERRRRWLRGLVVMVLTLGGGYIVAGPVETATQVAAIEETEAEENPAAPTLAEIMAQIEEVATRYRVPPRLVAAVIAVESEFNPRAVSRRGAQGLMQLMPATAASLDVQDSFDPRENIEGGVRHLRVLMDRYRNDLPLVLAAYNAGDTAVLTYKGVPPYRETRQYVIRVLRRYDRDAARAAALRIYGNGPGARPVRPSPPRLDARLMSYSPPPAAPEPAASPVSSPVPPEVRVVGVIERVAVDEPRPTPVPARPPVPSRVRFRESP
jgi:hypothetical protein